MSFGRVREQMMRYGDLRLLGCKLRLGERGKYIQGTAKEWEGLFGLSKADDGNGIAFTNATMDFVEGK